jgi:hypothetical protein
MESYIPQKINNLSFTDKINVLGPIYLKAPHALKEVTIDNHAAIKINMELLDTDDIKRLYEEIKRLIELSD